MWLSPYSAPKHTTQVTNDLWTKHASLYVTQEAHCNAYSPVPTAEIWESWNYISGNCGEDTAVTNSYIPMQGIGISNNLSRIYNI